MLIRSLTMTMLSRSLTMTELRSFDSL
jgi:hypothetical protein